MKLVKIILLEIKLDYNVVITRGTANMSIQSAISSGNVL